MGVVDWFFRNDRGEVNQSVFNGKPVRWWRRTERAEGDADAVMLTAAALSGILSGTSPSRCSPAGAALDTPGFVHLLRSQGGFQGSISNNMEIMEHTNEKDT